MTCVGLEVMPRCTPIDEARVLERNHPALQLIENTGEVVWLGGRESHERFFIRLRPFASFC